MYTDPRHYIERSLALWPHGLGVIDTRARLLDAGRDAEQAYDKYAFIRNAYLQRREYQVTDGDGAARPPLEDEPLEDPEPDSGREVAAQPRGAGFQRSRRHR